MSDGDALLAAIRAHPDEDAPRLVYADWLQEQGDEERAAFIRVAVHDPATEFARLTDGDPSVLLGLAPAGGIRMTDGSLRRWMWHDHDGDGPVVWDCGRNLRYKTDRGLICWLRAAAVDWFAHADAILAGHPVRRVALTTRPVAHTTGAPGESTFPHDPARKFFSFSALRDECQSRDSAFGLAGHVILPMLRLRFGRGITFDVPPG